MKGLTIRSSYIVHSLLLLALSSDEILFLFSFYRKLYASEVRACFAFGVEQHDLFNEAPLLIV